MKSIIQTEKKCFVCGTAMNLHEHHCFFGANRKIAEKDGLKVYLCGRHHNMSNEGVHFNRDLDLKIKQIAEKRWLEYYGKTIEDFIKRYRKKLFIKKYFKNFNGYKR